jgi:hypothetical protein
MCADQAEELKRIALSAIRASLQKRVLVGDKTA